MGLSENRIRMVQGVAQPVRDDEPARHQEPGLPFPATGGGPGGYITVYPTGHPEGISGPEFYEEIKEDERRRPLGRERRLMPGPEFSGREEFEARGRAAMGPPLPPPKQVPGDVAGPGAEDQITNQQVAQFLARLPHRNAGRGAGEALEGVRVRPAAKAPQKPKPAAAKPNPKTDRFGREPAVDRALAAEQADRERTQGQMDEMIAARRQGEENARAKGFRGQHEQQQASLEKTKGGRAILKDQWVTQMHKRYGGLRDSNGNQLPREFFSDMYDDYSQGNTLTHRETVMNAAVGLKDLKVHGGKGVPYQTPQQEAAKVRANQMERARRLGIPLEDVQIADGYIGAKNTFDLARHGLAADMLRPGRGHGNAAVALGIEDANARAVQGLGNANQTPLERLRDDQQRADEAPIGERAQAYRLQHRALNNGQPGDPQAENLHLVNAGAQSASQAAASALAGNAGADEMAFLKEYTAAFTSGGESTNRAAFNKWARRLGIPVTEESMDLWFDLTGTNVRHYNESVGDFFNFQPGTLGNYFFPNVPSAKDEKPPAAGPKPAPAKGEPAKKPNQVSPRATPSRRPFKDE